VYWVLYYYKYASLTCLLVYLVTSATVKLFADDTVLYHRVSTFADLQYDFDALQKWESVWLMEFNPSCGSH